MQQEEWQIAGKCSGNYGYGVSSFTQLAPMRAHTRKLTVFRFSPSQYFKVWNASVATWYWNTTVPVKGSPVPNYSDSLTIIKQ